MISKALGFTFKPLVSKMLRKLVKPFAAKEIQTFLDVLPRSVTLPMTNGTVRTDVKVCGVKTHADAISLYLYTAFVNTERPDMKYPTPLPEVPEEVLANMERQSIGMMATVLPFNQALWVLHKSGFLHFHISPDMVPENSPMQLNTHSLAAICPRLLLKPRRPVNLIMSPAAPPEVTLLNGKLHVRAVSIWEFRMIESGNSTKPLLKLETPLGASISLEATGENNTMVNPGVSDLRFGHVTVVESHVGHTTTKLTNKIFHALQNLALKRTFHILGSGVPILNTTFMSVKNLAFNASEVALAFATDFELKDAAL